MQQLRVYRSRTIRYTDAPLDYLYKILACALFIRILRKLRLMKKWMNTGRLQGDYEHEKMN